MIDRYTHISQAVVDQPWAIVPEVYARMVALLELRQAGITLTKEDIEARIGGAGRERPETQIAQGVGVISMMGVIAQRMNLFSAISGGTSVEQMTSEFRALHDDREVKAIVFAIDSVGGSVYGIEEFANEIRAARGKKPIVAVADSLAASGAYWLGSQADEFVVTPSGDVGSVGVVMAHTDVSAASEKAGIKTTLISAGKYKTEGNPYGPLSEEAIAFRQERVTQAYAKFVRAVAAGRGVSEAAVRTGFGEGRIVSSDDALALGMVDRVATFDATLARLQQTPAQPSSPLAPRADTTQEPPLAATVQDRARDADRQRMALALLDL